MSSRTVRFITEMCFDLLWLSKYVHEMEVRYWATVYKEHVLFSLLYVSDKLQLLSNTGQKTKDRMWSNLVILVSH